MNIKIGDTVFARFPNSALGLGGVVLMIVQVQGKEPEYNVQFSTGATHTFPASQVIAST